MGSFNGRGVQRVFMNLVPELARRGHRVTLLTCRAQGALRGEALAGVRQVLLVPRMPMRRRVWGALMHDWHYALATSGTPYLSRLPALVQFIESERPDVVISGGTRCNLLNAVARRAAAVTYQAALTEHNPLSGKAQRRSRRWKLRSVVGLYPHADVVAGVSAGVSNELARLLGRNDVPVLPNPVVTPEFRRQRTAPPPHPWLTDGKGPVLLAVGALESRKNFTMLLRALTRLRERIPARLIVLGDGPERRKLERMAARLGIAGALSLPGFTANVAAYLASADAFALSSKYEGFGCVIVEALACGCPVVSTDCPYGPREILADGRFGRLVAADDATAMARGLEQALSIQPDRRLLVERAAQYSVERAADAYLTLLAQARAQDTHVRDDQTSLPHSRHS
jgi:glycosyltransferase involved in cell wall biosynthesis